MTQFLRSEVTADFPRLGFGTEKLTDLLIFLSFTPQPLQIKSVVAPDHVKGYIYVESYKQTHVKAAIEGIGNLRMGFWNQQMVPIKEMTDVLKVVKEVTNLKPKSWVRLKRGLYKDDIAQVLGGGGQISKHVADVYVVRVLSWGLKVTCSSFSPAGGEELFIVPVTRHQHYSCSAVPNKQG